MEEHGFEKSGRISVNFDVGEMPKYGIIMLASFIATLALAGGAARTARNSAGLTILLALAGFIALFLAMRFGKEFLKGHLGRYGWIVIPPALAATFLASSIKPVVFAILFMLHGMACLFLTPLKNTARLGIELIMLITVLGSLAYGPKTGALFGAAAMLMDYALTARLSYFVPVTTAAYALIGTFAGNFSAYSITTIGIAATVIYNIVVSVIIVAFMGGQIEKCLRFGISNIALNAMLFTSVAPWLLQAVT